MFIGQTVKLWPGGSSEDGCLGWVVEVDGDRKPTKFRDCYGCELTLKDVVYWTPVPDPRPPENLY